MDKETLSNYGWIVVLVLILAVMLALASPFGTFIAGAIKSTTAGLFSVNQAALGSAGINVDDMLFPGCEHTDTEIRNATDGYTGDMCCKYCNEVVSVGKYVIPEGAVYYVGVTNSNTGKYTGATATYTAGQEFPETVTKGDVYVYGDYEYRYNQRIAYGSLWMDYTSQNGWGVFALSKTKTSYGPIQEVINGQPITSLGMTFENCKNMTQSPKIPDTVIHMMQTFNGCSSLEVLPELPDCVNYMSSTFANCTSLVDISYFVIPSNVTQLDGVWSGCTSLIDKGLPTIPGTVQNVSSAFTNCTGLVDLSDYRFSEGTTMLYQTFKGCTSLKYAPDELPDSMKYLDWSFQNCTSLVRIPKIKSTVASINSMFSGCTSLEKVSDRLVIPARMSIKYAFQNCTSLSDEITVSMYSNIGYEYQDCFKGTTQPITLKATKGSTMEKIYNLAATSENGNITVIELS